ncbi:MAG: diguanylate cyclase [Anaerolineae bacterium]|nr:diguanylate cyclase [Anaerolineae bacterium]
MSQKMGARSSIGVFANLGKDLAATTSAEEAAQIIVDAAHSLIGWDACYLILYDPQKGGSPRPLLSIDTAKGMRITQRDAFPQKPSPNMLKAIAEGGFISLYAGFFEMDASQTFGDRTQRTLSQMFVPVVSGLRTIGVLSIQSYARSAYQNPQLDMLKTLAGHCAGALERIWAQEALGDFVERLKVLHAAVSAINASFELERICQVVYETVSQVMPCNDFVIDGYDPKSNEIVPIYAIEEPGRRVITNRYVADHGMAGEIVRTKTSLLFNNLEQIENSGIQFELYGSFEEEQTKSILAVPMILHGEIYGMVSAQSYQESAYTDEDIYLLEVLASHASIAIENARLFDSIQKLANTDPLTGILNRRRFFELAELEFTRAKLTRQQLSVIMLDVDDFKHFNDLHGHQAGDKVLELVAVSCASSLRSDDIFGRLGGEEFAVVLPNTSLSDAHDVATRLRLAIRGINLSDMTATPVTVSVGVSEYDATCKTFDIMIERADKAMYAAKNAGRNQVHVWVPEGKGNGKK